MKTRLRVLLIPVVLVSLLVIQPSRSVLAGATGSFGVIYFSGASATNCGSWRATGSVTITPPGNIIISVTDGTGSVVAGFAQRYPPGTYTLAGGPFTSQPSKNPIRVIIVIDGVTVSNVAGDNPCLPPSDNGPKFFNPGDDRLNRDPGQPAALYCRNQGDVHIYTVNPDDSIGKFGLVVTKAEIDKVINSNPTVNTLIKQSADGKAKLYYLPITKELSFITTEARSGKPYSFVWKGLCR